MRENPIRNAYSLKKSLPGLLPRHAGKFSITYIHFTYLGKQSVVERPIKNEPTKFRKAWQFFIRCTFLGELNCPVWKMSRHRLLLLLLCFVLKKAS